MLCLKGLYDLFSPPSPQAGNFQCRFGESGKLHPVAMANAFHTALQKALAKLRGDPRSVPFFAMMLGTASYSHVCDKETS